MKTKDRILVVLSLMGLIVLGVLAKERAKLDQQIDLALTMESLVMPAQNQFSQSARDHLVKWTDRQIAGMNSRVKFFPFHRSRVQDAISRLDRCKHKLNKEDLSNKASEATSEPAPGAVSSSPQG